MQPYCNIWSYCTSYTWMEHFFIICQQLCSFNANSDLVLSDGCNVYKMRNVFFITFPYLPFLFPLHITGKYKPSKKSSTKFYKILQWIFVKLILIRIHKLPWQQEIDQGIVKFHIRWFSLNLYRNTEILYYLIQFESPCKHCCILLHVLSNWSTLISSFKPSPLPSPKKKCFMAELW